MHRQVLNNRTDELVAARKRLNLKCNKLRKFDQNEMLESGLEGFQDKHVLGQTREVLKVLKETLRKVRMSWLERRSKGEVSNVKSKRHYENLFTNRPASEKFVESSLPVADSGPPKGAEVPQALRKINTGKAPGESQITSDLLKMLEKKILKPLTRTFTDIWLDPGKVPQTRREAVVLNLFKKGSRAEPNNYQSIFLLDQVCKVFAKVIANRVNKPRSHLINLGSEATGQRAKLSRQLDVCYKEGLRTINLFVWLSSTWRRVLIQLIGSAVYRPKGFWNPRRYH